MCSGRKRGGGSERSWRDGKGKSVVRSSRSEMRLEYNFVTLNVSKGFKDIVGEYVPWMLQCVGGLACACAGRGRWSLLPLSLADVDPFYLRAVCFCSARLGSPLYCSFCVQI